MSSKVRYHQETKCNANLPHSSLLTSQGLQVEGQCGDCEPQAGEEQQQEQTEILSSITDSVSCHYEKYMSGGTHRHLPLPSDICSRDRQRNSQGSSQGMWGTGMQRARWQGSGRRLLCDQREDSQCLLRPSKKPRWVITKVFSQWPLGEVRTTQRVQHRSVYRQLWEAATNSIPASYSAVNKSLYDLRQCLLTKVPRFVQKRDVCKMDWQRGISLIVGLTLTVHSLEYY